MNNHYKNSGHGGMVWMMIACIILLGILFLGGGILSSSGYLWPILIGVFILGHIWMMFRGHGGHGNTNTSSDTSEKQVDAEKEKENHIQHDH